MNIIAICGSPRKGNTEFTLKRVLAKAEELGAKTELILLREKRIEFCDGCLSCDSAGQCKIRDDMQIIYPRLEENDVIIFGSPNYFNNVSGLMKNFIDRLLPYYYKNKLKDKNVALVVVGASDKIKMIEKSVGCIKEAIDLLDMSLIGEFSLVGKDKPDDVENNPESIKKIDEFAKNLVGG